MMPSFPDFFSEESQQHSSLNSLWTTVPSGNITNKNVDLLFCTIDYDSNTYKIKGKIQACKNVETNIDLAATKCTPKVPLGDTESVQHLIATSLCHANGSLNSTILTLLV